MGKKVELTGRRFGRLVVIEQALEKSANGALHWKCKCDCGNEKIIRGTNLTSGKTLSCGCYNREVITKENPKYKRKLYYIFRSIKDRCEDRNNKAFKNYGGRGISVEWKTYEEFEEWCMNHGYKEGLWIDRINNDGNYSPDNCRFCTPKEQQNNKRTNVFITIDVETLTIQQWADKTGIKRATIERRYELGWRGKDLIRPIDKTKSHSESIKNSWKRRME